VLTTSNKNMAEEIRQTRNATRLILKKRLL
jgi:hypothetical protein